MNRSRWAVLVLVVLALGLSLAYGLKDKGPDTNAADLGPLQRKAALEPCPTGLGSAFPRISLPCLGGGKDVALASSGTGRPTLVNVYGSWCGPCQVEMPVLRAFYAKARTTVALVGVDTNDEAGTGLHFAVDMKQHWPAVLDDGRVVGSHFAIGVPLMVFVDATGKVTHVESGGYKDLATLEQDVKAHLGVTV